MLILHFTATMLLVGTVVVGTNVVSGQTTSTGSGQAASTGSGQAYPSKPIRMVTAEAGGGSDFLSRMIAQGLLSSLGQQVIVDNRGSANGAIAGQTVAKASPDGYTLLLYASTVWIVPLLQKVSYDPVQDLAPITLAVSSPIIVVVHPSVPANSIKELIGLAKAKPGEINYASSSTGSPNHLAAELFKAMAGINMVHVPYKGGGPALNAVVGGQVQLMFASASGAVPHINSGRLRPLAVTSAKPSALFPALPTVASSGVPDYETGTIIGIFAPAKTPPALIGRLNQEIARVLNTPDVKQRLLKAGNEAVGSSPEQLAAIVKSDIIKMGKVIKDAGIRAD